MRCVMKNSQRASKRAMELLYHVSPADYVSSFSPRDFTGSGVWGRPKASNSTPWHSIHDDFGLEHADYACHDGLHRVRPPCRVEGLETLAKMSSATFMRKKVYLRKIGQWTVLDSGRVPGPRR